MRRFLTMLLAVTPVVAAAVFLITPPASAASLQEVTNFGNNPSALRMFVYVPANVAAHPAIVVASHYCHGDGPAFFNGSDFGRLADQYGFVVIFPSVTRVGDQCFDVASTATLTHNGGSDSLGIISMVTYAEQHYNGDSTRVYAVGVSSGAMMTNVLLGAYPDVFKAGSAFAGVPFSCFSGPANSWNSDCANGAITKTAQQWGDLVRAAYPGYTGPRPRMQLWHGTADTTLNYVNFGEEIKQWTNVLGVSQTPTSTDSPQSGFTRTRYTNSSGTVLVEATSMSGVGHNLPVEAADAIHFFGLDAAPTSPSPTRSASPSASPTRSASPSASPTRSVTPSVTPTRSTTPTSATRSCTAAYTVSSAWPGGFTSSVTVTAGSSAITAWTVTLTLPSGTAVTNSWNGGFSGASGTVTVTNASYNGSLPAGTATTFGFQGTGVGTGVAASCVAS